MSKNNGNFSSIIFYFCRGVNYLNFNCKKSGENYLIITINNFTIYGKFY